MVRSVVPASGKALIAMRLMPILHGAGKVSTTEDFQRLLALAGPIRTGGSGCLVATCGALYPGGAERQVVNTLRGLATHGLRERLILLADRLTPDQPEQYDFHLPALREAGITAREIRRRGFVVNFFSGGPPHLRAALKALRPPLMSDIIDLYYEFMELKPAVVHAWLDWSNVRAGLAAVLAGVPTVIMSGRNLNPSHFVFNAPYLLPAYQALVQHPHVHLINNSAAGAADYAAWIGMPRERIGVLCNGVDFSNVARPSPQAIIAFRQSLAVPSEGVLVGGMFRFSPEKRPDLWIETAARIAAMRADCRFVIFGTGPLRERMVALSRARGLADRLSIRDVTAEPILALAAFDACLLTSSAEGTSNVLLEAQWIGTPVVATEGGGTRESLDIGGSGRLVQEADATVVAKAVLEVLDPAARSRARERGPAFIAARFGVERMIRETMELYGLPTPASRKAV